MQAFPNLIDGRTMDMAETATDINPSNLGDVVGESARGTAADVDLAIAAARKAFAQMVADDAARAIRRPRPRGRRDPRAQGRARHAPRARAGQAARRRGGRSGARRVHLQVLRGRSVARGRRKDRVGSARHRLSKSRASRSASSRRSRRGTFRSRFPRGRSRRRSRSATRSCSSRPSSSRRRRGRWSTSCSGLDCRRAC